MATITVHEIDSKQILNFTLKTEDARITASMQ